MGANGKTPFLLSQSVAAPNASFYLYDEGLRYCQGGANVDDDAEVYAYVPSEGNDAQSWYARMVAQKAAADADADDDDLPAGREKRMDLRRQPVQEGKRRGEA